MRRFALLSVAFAALIACGQRYYANDQDAGEGDAGADAADAGVAVDSATDVTSDGALPFCASIDAALCADFEDGGVETSFQTVASSPGATFAIDPGEGFASARSLHATLPAAPDAGEVDAYGTHFFTTALTHVVLESDVFFAKPTTFAAGNVAFERVVFHGANDVTVELFEQPTTTNVTISEPAFEFFDTLYPLPLDRWTHVKIDWDPRPPSNLEIWFDQDKVLSKQGIVFDAPNVTSLKLEIGLVRFNAPTPAFDLHFDDVVVTFP